MKKTLLLFSMLFIANYSIMAYNFEVDGLYFNVINTTEATVGVTKGDNTYKGSITIPEAVLYEGTSFRVTEIQNNAFANCQYLTHVDIGNNIIKIGVESFKSCSMLKRIIIPQSVTEIGQSAFSSCPSLEDFIIEDGDSPISFVIGLGKCTFGEWNNFGKLKHVYIGREITLLGSYTSDYSTFGSIDPLFLVEIGPKLTSIDKSLFIGRDDHQYPKTTRTKFLVFHSPNFSYSIENLIPHDALIVDKSSYKRVKENNPSHPIYVSAEVNFYSMDSQIIYKDAFKEMNRQDIKSVAFWGDFHTLLTELDIKEDMNPNCLYYFYEMTEPQVNAVDLKTFEASNVQLESNHPFECLYNIFTNKIEYSQKTSVWADGQKGWESIILPFTPQYIEASESGYLNPITTGSSGNFWLRQYVGSSDDAVYFASTSDGVMKANTPYLIAFPGDKMGKGSLEGQTITFKAKNVTIPVTTIPSIQKNGYTFVGNYDKTADEGGGWTLNAEGSAFVWSETVGDKPFSGYFKGEAPVAGASALRMSFGQMDNTTGLEQNMAELIDCADEAVYTLDGRKVITKDLKPGLYIKNNKKMMVR